MTMMLIAQGGAKMAQTGSRLLQPKYKNTRAGQIQRDRSRQGNLSQAQENTIMNRVGVNAGRTAEVARNRYAGSMINQGMGNSVAMNRGLREAQDDVRRTQYDTARGIYQNEELAKSNAKMKYAQAMDQDKAERRNAGIGMVSTALDTALKSGATEYGARKSKTPDFIVQNMIKEGKSAEEILGILRLLQTQG